MESASRVWIYIDTRHTDHTPVALLSVRVGRPQCTAYDSEAEYERATRSYPGRFTGSIAHDDYIISYIRHAQYYG